MRIRNAYNTESILAQYLTDTKHGRKAIKSHIAGVHLIMLQCVRIGCHNQT